MMIRCDNRRQDLNQKPGLLVPLLLLSAVFALPVRAQVNSGSDGHDGAFNPSTNTVINMADHPDGIYNYTSVNISNGLTVTFIPNAQRSPVIWLVQGNCLIAGIVSVNGLNTTRTVEGALGGPGGWRAGNAALNAQSLPGIGLGSGGGTVGTDTTYYGGNASFGTVGDCNTNTGNANDWPKPQFPAGSVYGNTYLLPLVGGSGGSGGRDTGGGGGGGAIMIAVSGTLTLSGQITARGGDGRYDENYPGYGTYYYGTGGAGSGGSIRLVATTLSGGGTLDTGGGSALYGTYNNYPFGGGYHFNSAGSGRIRLDALSNTYNGPTTGAKTSGFQPIILLPPTQSLALSIQSIAGIAVPPNPTASLTTPDVIIPGNQNNPIPIVVQCSNIPLNTEIIVEIAPANGPSVRAVGMNNAGTLASSTATVSVNMPRGGGTIQAKAVSGIVNNLYGAVGQSKNNRSLAATGWTASGERFSAVEVTATLGGSQQIAYLTESGKRFAVPAL